MIMKKTKTTEQIDLIELLQALWSNKYKILSIVILTLVFTKLYLQLIQKPETFLAKTQIKPITVFEEELYEDYNSFKEPLKILQLYNHNSLSDVKQNEIISPSFNNLDTMTKGVENLGSREEVEIFEINKKILFNLFVEKIQDGQFFGEAVKKFGLLKKEDFKNEEDFENAVTKLISLISIDKPRKTIEVFEKRSEITTTKNLPANLNIVFRTSEKKVWRQILLYVENNTNIFVKDHLAKRFEKLIKMNEIKKQYQLEDIETLIANMKDDYKKETSNRLVYLREQSAIARKLDISKNTLLETFGSPTNALIANFGTALPYYTKGYEMIDKEIELILERKNESAFMDDMLLHENAKRSLLQDKRLERIKFLFSNTPVFKSNFSAGSILVSSTSFSSDKKNNFKVMVLAGLISLFFGFIFVLISNALQNRK